MSCEDSSVHLLETNRWTVEHTWLVHPSIPIRLAFEENDVYVCDSLGMIQPLELVSPHFTPSGTQFAPSTAPLSIPARGNTLLQTSVDESLPSPLPAPVPIAPPRPYLDTPILHTTTSTMALEEIPSTVTNTQAVDDAQIDDEQFASAPVDVMESSGDATTTVETITDTVATEVPTSTEHIESDTIPVSAPVPMPAPTLPSIPAPAPAPLPTRIVHAKKPETTPPVIEPEYPLPDKLPTLHTTALLQQKLRDAASAKFDPERIKTQLDQVKPVASNIPMNEQVFTGLTAVDAIEQPPVQQRIVSKQVR